MEEKQILAQDDGLEIYEIDDFLSKQECERLIRSIKANAKDSRVTYSTKPEMGVDTSTRTSSTCLFDDAESEMADSIRERIRIQIGNRAGRMETLQGQFYRKGQFFKRHSDTFWPDSPEWEKRAANQGGQRAWTFMIYLNEPKKGGETTFIHAKTTKGEPLSITPVRGKAVLWNNLHDGQTGVDQLNVYAEHQGTTVEEGEKLIITTWFRES